MEVIKHNDTEFLINSVHTIVSIVFIKLLAGCY